MTNPRVHGIVGEFDPTEVATADDNATRRSDEFLALALLQQQVKAAGGDVIQAGQCVYCKQRCAPRAIYCDAECRSDHEAELATLTKQGRA